MRFSWLYNLLFENTDDPLVGFVGVTNDDGVGYESVRKSERFGKGHSSLSKYSKGSVASVLKAIKTHFSHDTVSWRYNISDQTLYIWDLNLSDKNLVESTKWYIEDKMRYPVAKIRHISSIDDDTFDRAHFRDN